jgi:hypothetical protein
MMNISIRKCIVVIVFSMTVPFLLHAQQKNTISPQKTAVSKPTASNASDDNDEIDPADVETAAKKVIDKLKSEKESNPVPVTLLTSYANKFTRFSKYPRIETDTKITIVWYKSVSESLSKLAEVKIKIEVATFNKEEKQLEELNKAYKEFVTKIIYILEHPQKISERK